MGTIHVRIRHDHDLVIAKLGDVKIISIPFGKSAAKSIDHGLDLCVCQNLINGGFLHIQNLTADWQNRLVVTVSGSLRRTAGGISLYNKDFTKGRILFLTVCKLAVGIEGIFLPGEKVGLCTLLCFTDFSSLLCAGSNSF